MPTPDTYLPNTDYTALLDALTALDRDPAHPQPLRDRITEALGEIAGVWPASISPERSAELTFRKLTPHTR